MTHQLEQLLTCCICLDRFRNPKLLPCQHSVCMEPCMEGLVDYVRRQVKCPECRAEHRIPYNGVQGFPTNVTLQRFLEAHIEITGETPDPHTGQFMERCSVCTEKAYLSTCSHCDKKVCPDCKAAHTDILKREIGRINNQVKRAAHRLNEQLVSVEKSLSALKVNATCVTEELDNISKRLQKSVRDRCDFLKSEVDSYYNTELRNMTLLKEGLDQEISNVDANIDLAEKHMDDMTPWDDAELMDTKDIFIKTMEFIRSFDYDPGDYNRRARFNPPDDLNKIATTLSNLGELIIYHPNKGESFNTAPSMLGSGGGLMKSKSDHRLAVQFRDQEEAGGFPYTGRTSPVMKRRFGERPPEKDDADSTDSGRRKFRSRFMNARHEEEEKSVRFSEDDTPKTRSRVIDTEDVSRGPLSGITRMYDSPRVIKRLQERETNAKRKKDEPLKSSTTTPKPPAGGIQPRKTSRQTSNEDEIDKIKKQNKVTEVSVGASATTSSLSSNSSSSRPAGERVSSLKDEERQSRISDRPSVSSRSATHSPSSTSHDRDTGRTDYNSLTGANGTSTRTTPSRKSSIDTGVMGITQRSYPFSRSSSTSSVGESNKTSGNRSPRSIDTATYERRTSRSNSTDSNKSVDGSTSPTKKKTGAAFSTDELKHRFGKTKRAETSAQPAASSAAGSSNFSSRFLGRAGTPTVEASKESGNEDEEEDESSDDSESEESEDTSEEEEEKEEKSDHSRPDVGLLLGRSAYSRDTPTTTTSSSTKSWNDRTYTTTAPSSNDSGYGSRYGSSSDNSSSSSSSRYAPNASTNVNDSSSSSSSYRRPSYLESKAKEKEDDFDSKFPYTNKFLTTRRSTAAPVEEETKSPFQSRFLNRSKSSAIISPDSGVSEEDSSTTPTTTTAGTGSSRARFEELKERRQRLARSKSSAGMDEEETPTTADTNSSSTSTPGSYRSRYSSRDTDTSTTPSSRTAGVSASTNNDDGGSSSAQLSNWARYLKNKYGNKSGTNSSISSTTPSSGSGATGSTTSSSSLLGRGSTTAGATSSSLGSSSTRPISRSRSSHILGLAKDGESSEDDSKNVHATPTSQQADILAHTPFGSLHKSQYLQKQRLLLKIGSRGSEPGCFTWPRGVAVGPDNSIVVADSSNHRVQVFDQHGKFTKEFGSYGSGVGEFDCLAGVAVNRIGQYIIADRYNHRIQIFDPSGTFLRSFGNQGSGEGKFSYPWGVTTDPLGFIYVCDKENHRIQVFQSDGSFVGKFGTMGSKPGQLEHPHYIAVSSTNRVIVSDSNNHRIQIFDINGKVTSTFGSEGCGEGQFKFPRGVGVDEQGFIIVADSGNNRIQVFQPDGTFMRAFGCWGSGDGEFKGLEGVAVMSNGNILVCDRENHRVQVF